MKNLTVLDLHTNQFTGSPLPTEIVTQKNHALSFLALNENTFTGQIPDSIGMFAKLSHLDLSSNLVTGTIPNAMEHLSHLKYLFLSINAFDEGTIPTFLRNMTKLEDLSLKATGRTGTIPHWFGELSSLILMDLGALFQEFASPFLFSLRNLILTPLCHFLATCIFRCNERHEYVDRDCSTRAW